MLSQQSNEQREHIEEEEAEEDDEDEPVSRKQIIEVQPTSSVMVISSLWCFQELQEKQRTILFDIQVKAVAILRYLTDHISV